MREETIKLLGIFFTFLIVLDLILFLWGKIPALIFWIIVIISAIMAYKVLPGLRKKNT